VRAAAPASVDQPLSPPRLVLAGSYTARLAAERNHARLEGDEAAKVSELLVSLLTAGVPPPKKTRSSVIVFSLSFRSSE